MNTAHYVLILYYWCVYFSVKLLKTLRSDERCVFGKAVNVNLFCICLIFFLTQDCSMPQAFCSVLSVSFGNGAGKI